MDVVICPFCGREVAADRSICPFCGCRVAAPAATPNEALPAPLDPNAPERSAQDGGPKYEPVSPDMPDGGLSTAQYFWAMILFAIPLVGLGFMLYWSFGSTTCPARRRLARACLIKTGLFSVIATLAVALALGWAVTMGTRLLDAVEDYLYDSYYEDYEDYYGYGDGYGYGYGYGYGPYSDYYGSYGPYSGYYGSAPSGYAS